jgi:plastocyanin
MMRRSEIAAVLCAGAFVAGCGGTPQSTNAGTTSVGSAPAPTTSAPTATPSPTPTATPTATPTPTPTAKPAAGGGSSLSVAADPSGALKFTQTRLTAKAGSIKVDFSNPSPSGHDVAFKQGAKKFGSTSIVTNGSTSTTVKLTPGTYEFYCTVPGHEQAGMKGTLVVK